MDSDFTGGLLPANPVRGSPGGQRDTLSGAIRGPARAQLGVVAACRVKRAGSGRTCVVAREALPVLSTEKNGVFRGTDMGQARDPFQSPCPPSLLGPPSYPAGTGWPCNALWNLLQLHPLDPSSPPVGCKGIQHCANRGLTVYGLRGPAFSRQRMGALRSVGLGLAITLPGRYRRTKSDNPRAGLLRGQGTPRCSWGCAARGCHGVVGRSVTRSDGPRVIVRRPCFNRESLALC